MIHHCACMQVLKERDFPYSKLKMLASARYPPALKSQDTLEHTYLVIPISGKSYSSVAFSLQQIGILKGDGYLPWSLAYKSVPLAAGRSAGRSMEWDGESYTIEELTESSFGDVDIALFSAGGSISKKFAPVASDAGCTVRGIPLPCTLILISMP